MHEYTNVEAQVEYGLDSIAPDRTVEVSLQDLRFVYYVLGEFVRFFHQPIHYPKLEHVERFLGNADEGAFHLLAQCYYEKLGDVWPDDVKEMSDGDIFDNPVPPYYFEPTDEE